MNSAAIGRGAVSFSRRNFLNCAATAAVGGGIAARALVARAAPRSQRQAHHRCAVRAERIPAHRPHRQGDLRDAHDRDGTGDVHLDCRC